ncbi:MAG: STAS domain-containing protein [Bryobacteraceae bacterium]
MRDPKIDTNPAPPVTAFSDDRVTSLQTEDYLLLTPATLHMDSAIAKSARREVQQLECSRPRRIVFDLSGASSIDASGLGILVSAVRFLGSEGEVVLAGSSPAVAQSIDVARLGKLFTMTSTVDEATSHFAQLVKLQQALEEAETVKEPANA